MQGWTHSHWHLRLGRYRSFYLPGLDDSPDCNHLVTGYFGFRRKRPLPCKGPTLPPQSSTCPKTEADRSSSVRGFNVGSSLAGKGKRNMSRTVFCTGSDKLEIVQAVKYICFRGGSSND